MRQVVICVLWLASASAAVAENAPEKPTLVLDAGGHTASISKVLFASDGKELVTVSDDKTIRTWDVASGSPLRVLRPPIGSGLKGVLYAAALSPDGRTLAVGGWGWMVGEKPIYLVNLAAGRIERALPGHTNVINDLAFSPDGTQLASGGHDRTARVWDAATGRCERVLEGHEAEVYGVAFAPDGRRLATASFDKTVRVWTTADGRCEAVLRGHAKEVRCVAWRPDGKVVAAGGFDQSIRQWSPDGSAFRSFEGLGNTISSLAFTADSHGLLFARGQGGPKVCSLLDLSTGRERTRFDRHANTVLHGALSPDGTLAATSDFLGEVYLWRTVDGSVVHHLAGKGRPVFAVAWGRDGEALAWGNTNKLVLDHDRGPLEHTFRPADLERTDGVGPDLRRAQAARGSLALERTDKTTLVVRRAGATVATIKMVIPYETVRCFTLLPDDRAAVGTDFGLYLLDARTGNQLRSFPGHTGLVWAVAPSPDGRHLLSGSNDQTVRVWDPGRDEPLLSLFFAGDDWVAWTPEGYYAASPGGESLIGWHVNNGRDRMADFYPADKFRKTLYRPDVIKLVLKTGGTERALEVADRAKGKATERTEAAAVLPPEVEVAAPRQGTTLATRELEVRAIAKSRPGRPVTAMRLLLDGRPYKGQAGVKSYDPPKEGQVKESWTVELEPGPHALAIQAESAVSQATSDPVAVTVQPADPAEAVVLPALYVLAVGVSEYQRPDLRLFYAAKDAREIDRAFREKARGLFRKVETKLLTDGKATRADVSRGLVWLKQQMTQKDVGVLFFSGHGMRDDEGGLYLLPADVDPDDLMTTAVPEAQIKKALAGMPGRIITLLDACHAGAIGGDRRKALVGGLTDDLVRDLVTDDYGVIVMASSTGREFSLENNAKRQSNFTLAIVEGLSGEADTNKDGVVYLNELDNYVTDRVKALTKGKQHPVTAKPTSIRSFPLAKP